jgi:hypothetical protein
LNEPDGEMDEGRDEAATPETEADPELCCRSMGGAYGTAGDRPLAPRNDPAPPPSAEPPPPPFAPKAAAISGVDGVKPPPLPLPPLLDRPGARDRGLPDDEDEEDEEEEEDEDEEECREPATGGANCWEPAIGCAFALPRIEMADVSRALTTDCCGGKTLSFIGDTDAGADAGADAALPEAARTRGLLVPAGTTCVAIGVPSVANVHCTSMPPVGALPWWPAAPSALGSLLIEKSACGTGDAPRSAWC